MWGLSEPNKIEIINNLLEKLKKYDAQIVFLNF